MRGSKVISPNDQIAFDDANIRLLEFCLNQTCMFLVCVLSYTRDKVNKEMNIIIFI